jgi:hypothetical protein
MAQTKKAAKKTRTRASGKHGTPAPDPAEVIKDFTETTGRVVRQAAGILEEEVAAGISAVKKLEQGFLNVGELRASEKDQVLQRFRRDAHEVVDIALDVLSTASRYVSDLAGEAVTIRTGPRHGAVKTAQNFTPTVRLAEAVPPGGRGEVVMTLENSSPDENTEFSFVGTDLIGDGGARIASANIAFKPAKVTIAPGETADVTIVVKVPKTAAKGTYTGLIQASKWQQLRAVLVAEVG